MSKFKKNLNRILNDQLAINLDLLKGVHLMTESFQFISARIDRLVDAYNQRVEDVDAGFTAINYDLDEFAEDIAEIQKRLDKLEA